MSKAKYGTTRECHGYTGSKIHAVWAAMRNRCFNSDCRYYSRYGGRGITVCDRWSQFSNFLEDMGEPRRGETLDRIDNNAGYSKENCRWATRKVQSNNREVCKFLTLNGETKTIAQWGDQLGINRQTLGERIKSGWPVEKILSWKYDEDLPYFAHYEKIGGKGRNVLHLTFKGETKSFREWAICLDIPWKALLNRYSKGWGIEDILGPLVWRRQVR